jgi:phosphoribosyl-AMP cyclohydrolase
MDCEKEIIRKKKKIIISRSSQERWKKGSEKGT